MITLIYSLGTLFFRILCMVFPAADTLHKSGFYLSLLLCWGIAVLMELSSIPSIMTGIAMILIVSWMISKVFGYSYAVSLGFSILGFVLHNISSSVFMLLCHMSGHDSLVLGSEEKGLGIIVFLIVLYWGLDVLPSFIVRYILKPYHQKLKALSNTRTAVLILLILGAMALMQEMLYYFYYAAYAVQLVPLSAWSDALLVLAQLAVPAVVFLVVFLLLKERDLESLLNAEKRELEILRHRDSELIRVHHDVRSHMNMIRAFLEKGDVSGAETYLEHSMTSFDEEKVYSKNVMVNAVLHYLSASAEDIELEVESALDNDCGIDSQDLGLLVLNLVNERIDLIHQYSLSKKISLTLRQKENMVYLSIDSEMPDQAEKGYAELTRQAVKNIVRKYNGFLKEGLHTSTDLCLGLTVGADA